MQFLHFSSMRNIPGLRHAVTTRGGTCRDAYDALNLAYHVGDDAARVTENRRALAQELGYDAARLVAAQQVHGINSRIVSEADAGRGAFDWDGALPDCDALIVQAPRVPVLIQVADCAPILLVDPKNHVLAVVHAGWRGAVEGIVFDVLLRMRREFGTQPRNVVQAVGPCLCIKHLEVGPEVQQLAQRFCLQAVHDKKGRLHFDLRMALYRQFREAGLRVNRGNFNSAPYCPHCHNNLFFSHRGQNGVAGRFGLVAWWEA